MAKMNCLIFVGGIHGVGKSTLCARICSEFGIQYLLASRLIKDIKNDLSEISKRVGNIDQNQNYLIAGLKKIVVSNKWYILDGHFTLFDSHGYIQAVPYSTFHDIVPAALIVLSDEPDSIRKRLLKRDGIDYDVNVLTTMQDSEIKHARLIGARLNINVYEVSIDDVEELKGLISRMMKKDNK